jgi:hypothetical protein
LFGVAKVLMLESGVLLKGDLTFFFEGVVNTEDGNLTIGGALM